MIKRRRSDLLPAAALRGQFRIMMPGSITLAKSARRMKAAKKRTMSHPHAGDRADWS